MRKIAKYLAFALALSTAFISTRSEVRAGNTGTAEAYLKQAKAFEDTGRYGDAERQYQQALREALSVGQNNPRIPDVQIEVGNFYLSRNQPKKAEDLFRKALDYRIRTVGKDHPETAKIYHQIGRVYVGEGRNAEAASNFDQALGIYKRKLERDRRIPNLNKREINLDIAEILDDLARTTRYTQGAHVSDVYAGLSGRIRANPQGDYYEEL